MDPTLTPLKKREGKLTDGPRLTGGRTPRRLIRSRGRDLREGAGARGGERGGEIKAKPNPEKLPELFS